MDFVVLDIDKELSLRIKTISVLHLAKGIIDRSRP